MSVEQVPCLVRELYGIVDELERLFPGRKFTPDGHLVGSIGEVLAAHYYGIDLLKGSSETHDGISPCGKMVQIKATQGTSVALRSEPEHLLVLKIHRDGGFEEVYNGYGPVAWQISGGLQKNGQRPVSLSKLSKLMQSGSNVCRIEKK